MDEIFIIGKEDNIECAETAAALEKFGVEQVSVFGPGDRVPGSGIVILVNVGGEFKDLLLSRACIGITAEDDLLSLSILKRSGIRTVTCGFSASCAVTISGTDGDRAAVGLQRDIISISGRTIEAREIPVNTGGIRSPFAIMAAVAAVLAADRQIS